ncbi:hypothetical protein GQ55_6G209100 [Panicum hallii var. hallii]|uniref:Uncharacterized protein n=1 Tax=Panicum hallii var. hallii TaxID=1504633 RepID=A0A2T7D800_9POAL|nr:hypothetical protein GQ55_6G209100 [Panicum hallii var. hallii]
MEGASQGHRSCPELRLAAPARGRGKPHPQRTAACNVRSWRRRREPRRPQLPACAARATGSIGGAGSGEPRLAAACRVRGWKRWCGAAESGARSTRRAAPAASGISSGGHGRAASSGARSSGPRRVAPAAHGPAGRARSKRRRRSRSQCAAGRA